MCQDKLKYCYGYGFSVWFLWMTTSFGALQPTCYLKEKDSSESVPMKLGQVNNQNRLFESVCFTLERIFFFLFCFTGSLHFHQSLKYLTYFSPDLFYVLYNNSQTDFVFPVLPGVLKWFKFLFFKGVFGDRGLSDLKHELTLQQLQFVSPSLLCFCIILLTMSQDQKAAQ